MRRPLLICRCECEPSVPAATTSEQTGGGTELVAKFVEGELAAEEARKDSIESRGSSVISSSGALVTILFALAALVTGQDDYIPPDPSLWAILIALGLFVLAAVLGLLTGAVRNYDRVKLADVQNTVDSDWDTISDDSARKMIVESNLDVVRSARSQTNGKAQLLKAAVICQVAAVAALAFAVGVVLTAAL